MHRVDRRIGATVTSAVILRRRDSAPACALPGGCAQLLAFGLKHVVQAPFGELDASGEPEISSLFHVMDDAAQPQGTPRAADDLGMHRHHTQSRPPPPPLPLA